MIFYDIFETKNSPQPIYQKHQSNTLTFKYLAKIDAI